MADTAFGSINRGGKSDCTDNMSETVISYDEVDEYIKKFLQNDKQEETAKSEEAEEKATPEHLKQSETEAQNAAAAEKQAALSEIVITTGFSFEGYHIARYSGYISCDDAVQIPRIWSFLSEKNGQNLTDALVKIRKQALYGLKEAAYELGCNAITGLSFNYITLEPEIASVTGKTGYRAFAVCVTASGNAVIIEKD